MPRNDQANDRYDAPGIGMNDFEPMQYDEIEDEDLFWLNQNVGESNPPYRKITESEAGNTKTRTLESFNSTDVVYQRT